MTTPPRPRSRAPSVIAAIIVLPLLYLGWNMWYFSRLQSDIDARARDVAAAYNDILAKDLTPTLAAKQGELAPEAQTALATINGTSIATNGQSLRQVLEGIVRVQTGLTQFVRTLPSGDAMRQTATFASLQKDIADEHMNPLLLPYNRKAQEWNNALEAGVGKMFARARHWEKVQLLRPDGRVEYETTATF